MEGVPGRGSGRVAKGGGRDAHRGGEGDVVRGPPFEEDGAGREGDLAKAGVDDAAAVGGVYGLHGNAEGGGEAAAQRVDDGEFVHVEPVLGLCDVDCLEEGVGGGEDDAAPGELLGDDALAVGAEDEGHGGRVVDGAKAEVERVAVADELCAAPNQFLGGGWLVR